MGLLKLSLISNLPKYSPAYWIKLSNSPVLSGPVHIIWDNGLQNMCIGMINILDYKEKIKLIFLNKFCSNEKDN